MYISGFWFLGFVAGILILAAAMRGTRASLYLLIPAGAVFLLMSSLVFSGGVEIPNGKKITVYNETKVSNDIIRTENKTTTYENVFNTDSRMNNWFGAIMTIIGIILILIGTDWRFI